MIAIADYLETSETLINERLRSLVLIENTPYAQLYEAAYYSLMGKGKRLRPILALATVEVLNGKKEAALTAACALELIHTYSLIHDDLPCMDNDDFRRGRPTLHKVFSEGHAVLTGDFLLTYAFQILAEDPLLSPHQKIRLIHTLAHRAGSHGMIGGQVMDLAAAGKVTDLETLQLIHKKKTGALIAASIEFGGIIGNASEQHFALLKKFGQNIGLAFQIVDDILDVTAGEKKHGKQGGSDVANQKVTYASLLGVEQSQAYAQAFHQSALDALKQLPHDTFLLQHLAEHILGRTE